MSTRHKGIIAYGTDADRLKLAVLAQLTGKSGSEVVIQMIREKYSAVLGDADPERVTMHH